MNFFKNIFNKKEEQLESNEINEISLVSDVKNWYSDRYETAIVQRNVLFTLLLASIFIIFFGAFILGKVASSKTLEPFVVQIDEKTGITNVVNPLNRRDLLTNEALNTYFIIKYIRAREASDPANSDYNREVARVLSTGGVFREFLGLLNSSKGSNQPQASSITIRSVQFIESQTAQVRFTIETANSGNKIYKIATIRFSYTQMEMNQNERLINPLGFRITSYRSDNEVL